jgi:hypothetical protein
MAAAFLLEGKILRCPKYIAVNLRLTPSKADSLVNGILELLRSGAFINKQRIVLWPAALLISFVAAILFLAATAHGIIDYKGRPLGSDFSSLYAAGTYVREGQPSAPFDPMRQYEEEQALFGKATPFISWQYPPILLPVAELLASLPYIPALLVWQLATLAFYLGAMVLLLRGNFSLSAIHNRSWVLLAVAFPAVFVNFIHGQNGFLTAALLAGGLALFEVQPILAGVFFGLLAYKPQFLPIVPLALIAAQRWRVLAAMMLTILILAGIAAAVCGSDTWRAFLASTQFAQTAILDLGEMGFEKMQSVFAWVRLWGGSVVLAALLQGIVSLSAAVAIIIIGRKPATFADRGAALCLAVLLTTPYCLDYDLMALAPAIALLGTQGIERGFRPYEKSLLVVLWVVPIIARESAEFLHLPLGTIAMLMAVGFLARRVRQPEGSLPASVRGAPTFARPLGTS